MTALHWKQLPYIASGNAEVTHARVDRNKGLLASTYTVQHCTNGSEIELGQADKANTKVDICLAI